MVAIPRRQKILSLIFVSKANNVSQRRDRCSHQPFEFFGGKIGIALDTLQCFWVENHAAVHGDSNAATVGVAINFVTTALPCKEKTKLLQDR